TILSYVLLRAESGKLALSATDMDLEIVERVAVQIEREGRTTAPAHTLYDIVRKLRDGAQIEIETSGERNAIVLRSGRSTFTLACLPPEDYPLMAGGELPYNFSLSATELRTLIDRTFPAYDRVIPSNNDKVLEVECKSFAEAVDRVSTISTEKSRAVKLAIENGNLVVSATSPENGTAVEELEVRYSASPLEIGF